MVRKIKWESSAFTLRNRVILIVLGLAIGATSLLFTNHMARMLRQKELYEVQLWSLVLQRMDYFSTQDELFQHLISGSNSIPFVLLQTTSMGTGVYASNLVPENILNHPDTHKLQSYLESFSVITIRDVYGNGYHLFYGESSLLKMLRYFPLVQMLVIIVFVVFSYLTLHSTKQDEQNQVWIGLAKETAHQLGTPISSLLGWIEYLRSQPIDQGAVEEMNKDLTRLTMVVERFSKIGSETVLSPANVNEIVGNSVLYFRSRIPRNVTLTYNGLAIAPVQAMVNTALFEWVIENLLKNALDALQGKGNIDVKISSDEDLIYINVKDTGKGIPKANIKRIFEPGFTTKTRGWGLGLSLSRRIIEDYHHGRIAVAESTPGEGTTMRVTLKKVYL